MPRNLSAAHERAALVEQLQKLTRDQAEVLGWLAQAPGRLAVVRLELARLQAAAKETMENLQLVRGRSVVELSTYERAEQLAMDAVEVLATTRRRTASAEMKVEFRRNEAEQIALRLAAVQHQLQGWGLLLPFLPRDTT